MSRIIIGIDPDSSKHGVAIYENGKLIHLKSMPLTELMGVFRKYEHQNPVVHIENVCGNNAVFMKEKTLHKKVAEAKARGRTLGMCQQAQKEAERMAEYYGIEVVKRKISKQWKSQSSKRLFELATGWKGRSNEDTRSAAYFGFMGAK